MLNGVKEPWGLQAKASPSQTEGPPASAGTKCYETARIPNESRPGPAAAAAPPARRYNIDFGETPRQRLTWLLPHLRLEAAAELREMLGRELPAVKYAEYDWTANAKL